MKPCLAYAGNSQAKQLLHIVAEVWEVTKALLKGDYIHAAEELADVQVSCETMLYILGYKHETEREYVRMQVDDKNAERGYHKEVE